MAVKTLLQLRTDVKNLVDNWELSDQVLTGWINEALADLAPVLRKQGTTSIPIVAGTAEYALPDDFLDLRMVKLASQSSRLPVLALEDFVQTGVKIWGDKLVFQPAPVSSDTALVWYYRVPPALSADTDKPDMPEAFQHLLVLYAASRTQYKDEEIDEQSVYYREYLQGKTMLDQFTARLVARTAPRQWKVER